MESREVHLYILTLPAWYIIAGTPFIFVSFDTAFLDYITFTRSGAREVGWALLMRVGLRLTICVFGLGYVALGLLLWLRTTP
jgi:hypothetical protein